MATTAIARMRSLLRVAGDVPCKQKKKKIILSNKQKEKVLKYFADKKENSAFRRQIKKENF